MFAYQNTPMETLNLHGLKLTPIPHETGISKFDITLSLQEEGGTLKGMLETLRRP